MDGRSKIPYLPADIINSILLQLPVKSLSRFKSCCKSWHCCIDDADFIKSHLRNSSVDISRQKFVLVHLKPSPSTYKFEIVSTEASINADSKVVPGYSMILFNPALGKYKLIPNSLFSRKKRSRCSDTSPIFGFAYDFVADDYKVICAYYLINYLHSNQVSLNSVIHRMSHNREVISFHLVDEKFTVTAVPKACGEQPTLHALGDGMCVFTTVGEESLIWSLEKDRWNCINKFHTLPSLIGMPIWPDVKPYTVGLFLFVKENGNILWRNHDGPFIEYHVRKNEYTEFKSIQIPPLVSSKALYVESLVSLKIPWD
ncbi:F-box protein At5g49610-like [Solanum lycopersicum]|uniref:F-box protein At5g49610-like n=1 Tax=Solanum lycopersicum TaxID=4081 RepID=UPI0037499FA5